MQQVIIVVILTQNRTSFTLHMQSKITQHRMGKMHTANTAEVCRV